MKVSDLLVDAFGRIRETVHNVVQDLSPDQLSFRVNDEANSIGWLVWHLTRIQDDHVADVAGTEQLWTSAGWAERFALPFDTSDTGYGHSSDQVSAVRVQSTDVLIGYHDAVHDRTRRFIRGVGETDLDRIIDESWDPPVSLGVRLISVISDDLQHVGQAAFVRGILINS